MGHHYTVDIIGVVSKLFGIDASIIIFVLYRIKAHLCEKYSHSHVNKTTFSAQANNTLHAYVYIFSEW